jgi:hypothetical protein
MLCAENMQGFLMLDQEVCSISTVLKMSNILYVVPHDLDVNVLYHSQLHNKCNIPGIQLSENPNL